MAHANFFKHIQPSFPTFFIRSLKEISAQVACEVTAVQKTELVRELDLPSRP